MPRRFELDRLRAKVWANAVVHLYRAQLAQRRRMSRTSLVSNIGVALFPPRKGSSERISYDRRFSRYLNEGLLPDRGRSGSVVKRAEGIAPGSRAFIEHSFWAVAKRRSASPSQLAAVKARVKTLESLRLLEERHVRDNLTVKLERPRGLSDMAKHEVYRLREDPSIPPLDVLAWLVATMRLAAYDGKQELAAALLLNVYRINELIDLGRTSPLGLLGRRLHIALVREWCPRSLHRFPKNATSITLTGFRKTYREAPFMTSKCEQGSLDTRAARLRRV